VLRPAEQLLKKRQLLLFPLVMTLFFDVSGGPYGLETAVSQSGAGVALLLILVTPFIWSLPAALMTAELTSAMPAEGGYYVWVKEGLGPFPAFLCGWWSWIYSWVDISIYPGMFVAYVIALGAQIPALTPIVPTGSFEKWLLGIAMLVPFTLVNIRGTRQTSISSVWLGLLLLSPFVVLVVLALYHFVATPVNIAAPLTAPGQSFTGALGGGLVAVMWNYLAWDSLSTVAAEADRPERTFPRGLFWALPLVLCAYLLPAAAGLTRVHDISQWQNGAWPSIAATLGGPVLGLAVGLAAILSVLGMFNATLLGGSRLPFVLAEDGYLPGAVTRVHPKYGTPWVAILASVVVAGALTVFSFQTILDIDVFIYSAALLLEFAALIALRYRRPEMPRPYKIPGGKAVVWIVLLVPTALIAAAAVAKLNDRAGQLVTLAILASGPIWYVGARLFRPRHEAS
jgi:amino acid transporter